MTSYSEFSPEFQSETEKILAGSPGRYPQFLIEFHRHIAAREAAAKSAAEQAALSRKVKIRSRKSTTRDLDILARLSTYEEHAAPDVAAAASVVMGGKALTPPAPTPLSPHTTPTKPHTPSLYPKPGETFDLSSPSRKPAPWEHTTHRLRLTFANRALSRLGQPYAFTLNVAPILSERASDDPKAFLDHMRRRIKRHLDHRLGRPVEFFCATEPTRGGRWHLHGGMAVQSAADIPAIKAALRRAGGEWAASRSGNRQVDVQPQTYPDGWPAYALKSTAAGVSFTNPLRTIAKELYEEARQVLSNCSANTVFI